MPYRKPCPIANQHIIEGFSSGKPSLDSWLKEMALHNQEQGYTRTFVIADENFKVVGYHSVCAGMIHRSDVSRSVKGSKAPTEIPIAVLARLAVDAEYQGNGLGKALLRNALMSVVSAAQVVAFRAVIIHALDDEAVTFYKKFGFQETKNMERRLILPTKDIAASLNEATG